MATGHSTGKPILQTVSLANNVNQLGIIAALPAEASCFAGRNEQKNSMLIVSRSSPQALSENVFLMISGIGAKQATQAAAILIEHGADALLSWGCAGALSAGLQSGDLILPRNIKTQKMGALVPDPQWHARLLRMLAGKHRLCSEALMTSDAIITEPAQKLALYQSSGAVAVDMESAAIGMAAHHAHIPFMVIRAIVDDAATGIPARINNAMDKYGDINHIRMLRLLLKHPSLWLRLLRLGRQFNAAKATLSDVTAMVGPDFLVDDSCSRKSGT